MRRYVKRRDVSLVLVKAAQSEYFRINGTNYPVTKRDRHTRKDGNVTT